MKAVIDERWKGMIPIRDKYPRLALQLKEDLEVYVREEHKVYVIPNDKLTIPYIIKKVPDKFSDAIQELLYYRNYEVAKEIKQNKLL